MTIISISSDSESASESEVSNEDSTEEKWDSEDLATAQPVFEALLDDFWWDVESLQLVTSERGEKRFFLRRIGFSHSPTIVEKQQLRLRSRRMALSDCPSLKEEMDVCVFALHPLTGNMAWHYARIQSMQRYGNCRKCRFTVHLYDIQGDGLVMDEARVVTINQIKILQAPSDRSFELLLEAAVLPPRSMKRKWSQDTFRLKDQTSVPQGVEGGLSAGGETVEDIAAMLEAMLEIADDEDPTNEVTKRNKHKHDDNRDSTFPREKRQRTSVHSECLLCQHLCQQPASSEKPVKKHHHPRQKREKTTRWLDTEHFRPSQKREEKTRWVDTESDNEEDLEVEQGYVVSLDRYWKGDVEEQAQSLDDVIWEQMRRTFRNDHENQMSTFDQMDLMCVGSEHDFVMDEDVGLVCNECGYIAIHMHQMAHHPTRVCRSWGREPRSTKYEKPMQFSDTFEEQQGHVRMGEGMFSKLHGHQKLALGLLRKNIINGKAGCILAHAPGTGKTRTTIAFYTELRELNQGCRLLVLAPKSVTRNWEREFSKCNVEIPVHVLESVHSDEDRLEAFRRWNKEKSVLVMTYELFRSIGAKRSEMSRQLLECPDLMVLDEGHTVRNSETIVWKTLRDVRTKLRILLSGTLFQNNFEELFDTISVVRPDFINFYRGEQDPEKRFETARKQFEKEIGLRFRYGESARNVARDKLLAMTRSFISHYSGEILKKLPGLQDYEVTLKLTDVQNNVLGVVDRNPKLTGFDREIAFTYTYIHPYLLSKKKFGSDMKPIAHKQTKDVHASVRMEFVIKLIELCQTMVSEKVLVFSLNIEPLLLLEEFLRDKFGWKIDEEILFVTGECKSVQRKELFERLNSKTDESRVCLLSVQACGEGVTLTGASRVVFLHMQRNPARMQQALSRAYRLGQSRRVFVYRLVCEHSVERKKNSKTAWKERVADNLFFRQPVDDQSNTDIFEEDEVLKHINEENPEWIIRANRWKENDGMP